ncbi:SoxY-related AACIE arm protein [Phreatobacter stygius]|uniref:SoxY-related AACIE arm protein n=1 Tax=Phreatobacter stygius TaxID=1940610 RepID=A0A4D7B843_9HYPH|nr:SoxY-related AACIE arm protein [Phreatobacter stygius]QCI64147.1 SoxY-related AACIE arm protein [Phreatobacter stygius]
MPETIAVLPSRRTCLAAGAGLLSLAMVRPARATPDAMAEAIRAFTGGDRVTVGRVTLDIPPLVENGNTVPLAVSVESPMTAADHVTAIAVFNEKNPQPNVATGYFGPRSGRAGFATRIRLADTQQVTAVARMSDGTFWSSTADVIVTLAACLEG